VLKAYKAYKAQQVLLVHRVFKAHRVSRVHQALPGRKDFKVLKASRELLVLLARRVSRV
jgi:hypothetical protein